MTLRISAALRQIGNDLAAVLSPQTIRDVCSQLDHQWRERIFDPVTTIHFVLQVLHHNTAYSLLARLTGQTFSASAYCQAPDIHLTIGAGDDEMTLEKINSSSQGFDRTMSRFIIS